MLSALDLLRELRAEREVQTRTESNPRPGEDVDGPWPVCATCGEPISGEGTTVLAGWAHHEGCAGYGTVTMMAANQT